MVSLFFPTLLLLFSSILLSSVYSFCVSLTVCICWCYRVMLFEAECTVSSGHLGKRKRTGDV